MSNKPTKKEIHQAIIDLLKRKKYNKLDADDKVNIVIINPDQRFRHD